MFRLGETRCALPLGAVAEVLPMAELASPPGLPSLLDGFLIRGGGAEPVVALDRVLGMPGPAPGLYTHLVELREPRVLLRVDRVEAIVRPGPGDLLPVRGDLVWNDCVQAEVERDGQRIHVLAPERLLLREEIQRLREHAETTRRRLEDPA